MIWSVVPALSSVLPSGIGPNPIDDPLQPPIKIDESLVTPGVVGFIVTALVALAAILLVIDMMRRVRRVRYRAEIREMLEAEQAMIAEGGPITPVTPEAGTSSAPDPGDAERR